MVNDNKSNKTGNVVKIGEICIESREPLEKIYAVVKSILKQKYKQPQVNIIKKPYWDDIFDV